eukprot:CAMPEP_0179322904 /NCGR_PEP_ID=MMETSP0797-20121207/59427_1 /TAXON_ID=47934 /ORGANISM="Dinophysis acuminata, Strain DAEP01" /LENGTH=137 /DNA_ID=CAMNT_0021034693 /DNA_START=1 /DNA_END=414 /DNA_ORIENTATION=+
MDGLVVVLGMFGCLRRSPCVEVDDGGSPIQPLEDEAPMIKGGNLSSDSDISNASTVAVDLSSAGSNGSSGADESLKRAAAQGQAGRAGAPRRAPGEVQRTRLDCSRLSPWDAPLDSHSSTGTHPNDNFSASGTLFTT